MSLGAITLDLTDLVRQIDQVRRVLQDQLTEIQDGLDEMREAAANGAAAHKRIEAVLNNLVAKGEAMSTELKAEIDRVAALVAQNTEVDSSAVTLLQQLVQMLRDAADDPVRVRALADELEASNRRLASSVTENTPAAPPTP